MLKLVHAFDMNFKSVLDYYNSFAVNEYKDVNCYAIRMVNRGEEEYFDWLVKHEKAIFYMIDTNNEKYIIGYGSIKYSEMIDYYKEYNPGHIGYGIRPNERNKKYGTKLLKLLLLKCEEYGMNNVTVSCHKGNIASQKIILNNNGKFEKEFFNDFEGQGLKYNIELNSKVLNKK